MYGVDGVAVTRAAIASAVARLASASTTTNSSLPYRKIMSPTRYVPLVVRATCERTTLPAVVPNCSLTDLPPPQNLWIEK